MALPNGRWMDFQCGEKGNFLWALQVMLDCDSGPGGIDEELGPAVDKIVEDWR